MDISILLKSQKLQNEIRALQSERDTLRACAENDTSVISLAPGHGQGVSRTMENILIRVADLDALIKEKQKRLDEMKEIILNAVARLDDPAERTVITLHYVMNKSWSETAKKMGYQMRYCKKLASSARQILTAI